MDHVDLVEGHEMRISRQLTSGPHMEVRRPRHAVNFAKASSTFTFAVKEEGRFTDDSQEQEQQDAAFG